MLLEESSLDDMKIIRMERVWDSAVYLETRQKLQWNNATLPNREVGIYCAGIPLQTQMQKIC